MRRISRSIAVPLFLLLPLGILASCGGDDGNGGGTEPPTTGDIRAQVTADGSAVDGVSLSLFTPGASTPTTTAATGSDGFASFSDLDPGSWDVEVDVPEGMTLAAGQAIRVSTTVTAGEQSQVAFSLEGSGSGEVVEVELTADFRFVPEEVVISPGTTVRWTNAADVNHTVTPEGHSEWSSASLAQEGQTFTHTFTDSGSFDYFCQPHISFDMVGTVVVQ